ncbi:acyl-CoA thioesterase/ catalytic/ hydrolase, acting on ester bonds [Zea mays]|uniref:14-dihydroxy-2-naphthoyl-CoA thioesterase 1 n=1 Tax=Zea mays TaxID=4577 RepID=C0P6T7_MAIZE|nr:acyl-CoA thioesterase/ catalytic/ hydrolase, acting on ester bonds [Zea mays]ACN28703.1 unknown [Zea mays]ONM02347.1 14-dihydroxy-2-naphthoyl-CoA thioesterase 1 [Zea mays]|eukprot:NP_001150131.1 acyl-CoA thioesterase/ catalytic/ hydrolase, acting on ester bonds [Zea mays]
MDHRQPPPNKTAELDPVLHSIGFQIEEVSPSQVTGRLPVTPRCCQPFQVLHGGVSALVAEGLASMGAHMASGFRRVAGVSLTINHFRSAKVGDVVLVRAAPLHVGRSTQVWDVKLWKEDQQGKKGSQISESRVTLLCNLPVPDILKHAGDALKKYADAPAAQKPTATSRL